jgi:Fe-S cluster biogenesis protein NfuA
LVRRGELSHRDVDTLMVAAGYLSYSLVDEFLAQRQAAARRETAAPPASLPRREVPEIAREIVDRICGCQYQDGGATKLVATDRRDIHLEVQGACVHCPQIKYTMDILERAIRFRTPKVEEVKIDGTRLEEKSELPVNRQLTLSMFLKATGLTYGDLDEALDRLGRLTDDDLLRLGAIKQGQARLRVI